MFLLKWRVLSMLLIRLLAKLRSTGLIVLLLTVSFPPNEPSGQAECVSFFCM